MIHHTPLLRRAGPRAINTVTHPCQARVASEREYWMLVYKIRLVESLFDIYHIAVPRRRIYREGWALRLLS